MMMGEKLVSAHAAIDEGSEAGWTTWKVRSSGEVQRTIDYLFYHPGTMRPLSVLEPPAPDVIDEERLPSWRYPSDHLSLLVRFERTSAACEGC